MPRSFYYAACTQNFYSGQELKCLMNETPSLYWCTAKWSPPPSLITHIHDKLLCTFRILYFFATFFETTCSTHSTSYQGPSKPGHCSHWTRL